MTLRTPPGSNDDSSERFRNGTVLNKPFPALSNLLLFHHQPGQAGGEHPRWEVPLAGWAIQVLLGTLGPSLATLVVRKRSLTPRSLFFLCPIFRSGTEIFLLQSRDFL